MTTMLTTDDACVVCTVDVLCGSPSGVLAAKSPPQDDVRLWTSSVSNARRTCSHIETSVERHDRQQVDVDEHDQETGDEETTTTMTTDSVAYVDETVIDPLQTVTLTTSDSTQQRTSVSHIADSRTTATTQTASTSSNRPDEKTSSQHSDAQSARPRPVPAPRTDSKTTTADKTTSYERPKRKPPISLVKPMIIHNTSNVQETAERQIDTLQLKPLSDSLSNQQQVAPSTAHAPSRGPIPVVARRHETLRTVDDIPSGVDTLSVADVAKCVTLLGLSQQQADLMAKHCVDGHQLLQLTTNQLTEEFNFTPLEANKLIRFARGWRPT